MSEVKNPVLDYADRYRTEAYRGQKLADIWSVITDLERDIAPPWDAQRLRADTAEADLVIWKTKACEAAERHVAAEQRNAALIGWRDPEFTWATIEASNKAKMQALGHDMDCFSTPIYGSTAFPALTEERREYEVKELAEFMSNLSGGLRHFAGYMIDAGWRKPTALNPNPEAESHER